MAIETLHSICLHRVYGLLKEGVWKFCLANPFSELPAQDIQRLMEMTRLHYPEDPAKISDVILLLTSGRILCLDLRPFYLNRKHGSIDHSMETQGNASSTSLSTFTSHSKRAHSKKLFIFHLVRSITSANRYIEEFHSNIHPGFDVLQNCQNLRILDLYPSYGEVHCPVDFSVLSSLRNLEVLHLPYMDIDTITNVLEICPNLISIGLEDSLDSMKEIHQKRLRSSSLNFEVHSHLQLRRCFWGMYIGDEDPQKRHVYESGFCDKVRFAVSLCPLVQELIFNVHVKEAVKELKFLKRLTLLKIHVFNTEDDFFLEFIALLREIGPQLKHLSICWYEPKIGPLRVPVDDIFEFCPHLESLEMDPMLYEIRFPSEGSRNFPLKRLRLSHLYDEEQEPESLLSLLSNCKHLEELFIEFVDCFDDAVLSQILERNCFTELKVVFVYYCSLTRDGCQMFMEKASSIQTAFIEVIDEDVVVDNYLYDADRVFKDPSPRYLKNSRFYYKFKELFPFLLDKDRF